MTIRMTVTGLACALALGACATTDDDIAMTEETMAEEVMEAEAATEEAMDEADAMMAEEEVMAAIEADEEPMVEAMEMTAVETTTVETTTVETTTVEISEEPLETEAAAAPAAAATTEAPADIRLCIKMGGQVNFRSTADGDFYQVCQMEDGGEIATETLYTVELANRGEEAMEAFLAE